MPRVVRHGISWAAWHDADMWRSRRQGRLHQHADTHRLSPLAKGNPSTATSARLLRRRATSRRKGDIPCLNRHSTFDGTRQKLRVQKTCQMACKDYKNIDLGHLVRHVRGIFIGDTVKYDADGILTTTRQLSKVHVVQSTAIRRSV